MAKTLNTSELGERRARANAAMDAYAIGDDSAFATLYELIASELWAFTSSRVRDRAAAEDLMQQTLLHMHRARGRYRRGASVHPWMYTIAYRLIVDRFRRIRPETALDEAPLSDPRPGPDELASAHELSDQLFAALETLPERQRAVVELVREAGLSHKETAEALGTTESAVKSLMHRALATLRGCGAFDEVSG